MPCSNSAMVARGADLRPTFALQSVINSSRCLLTMACNMGNLPCLLLKWRSERSECVRESPRALLQFCCSGNGTLLSCN